MLGLVILCLVYFLFVTACCQYQRNRLSGKTRLRNDLQYYVSSGTLNSTHTAHSLKTKITISSLAGEVTAQSCKTLNVTVPFISRAKQNREIKGCEYQLQANIGRNYYSISNCMVQIRQNKRRQNNFAC